MFGRYFIVYLCALLMISPSICFFASEKRQEQMNESAILGDWSGLLEKGSLKMTVALHVYKDRAIFENLSLKYETSLDEISFDGETLIFEKEGECHFEGRFFNREIFGQMTQEDEKFPVVFERGIKLLDLIKHPGEPVFPYSYKVEEVFYKSQENISLSGTLTTPFGEGPFPVVLLIAGAGAFDRNESVLGHKPFLVLADYLTRQGIGVLRMDKRGCGKSTGSYDEATTKDFADDVFAGVRYLKSRSEINPLQIGLIGHSEGGVIASMVSVKSKDVAFLVALGAPSILIEELLYEQNDLSLKVSGEKKEVIEEWCKLKKQMFSIIKKESDLELAKERLEELIVGSCLKKTELQAFIKSINTKWFRFFLTFDPSSVLKRVQVPLLALYGENDLVVPPKKNLPAMEKWLREGRNRDYKVIQLPKIDHLLQTSFKGSKSLSEYSNTEETIAPAVLEKIGDWILEKISQKESRLSP